MRKVCPSRVLDEHFADAPRLVAWRLQNGDPLAIAHGVDGVHVGHPDRQPRAVIATTALRHSFTVGITCAPAAVRSRAFGALAWD
jgi:thiamine monophosphate synthase